MKRYEFTITLSGVGETQEEGWNDACEGFDLDPGCPPEDIEEEEIEE